MTRTGTGGTRTAPNAVNNACDASRRKIAIPHVLTPLTAVTAQREGKTAHQKATTVHSHGNSPKN